MIPPGDIAALRAAFQANPSDLGVGLYNPITGEARLGSFDSVTQRQGHQGLADALGIVNNAEWRGFIVRSDGQFLPMSHFNNVDGSVNLLPIHETAVRQLLRQAGLIQ